MELLDFQHKWGELVEKWSIAGYDTLTDHEKVWLNIQTLIQDVDNGGLISHYYNSGADTIDDTIEDLKKLGVDDFVSLLGKMNSLFPNSSPPKDIKKRNEIINSFNDEVLGELLTKLDKEFFDKENVLEQKLAEYINQKGLA